MNPARRGVIFAAAAAALSPSIGRALAIDADARSGTIADVGHVVILMQENRSFDHYFGALNGVRGFADRFPIPIPGGDGATVWNQTSADGTLPPFPLETDRAFANMRMEGTPHNWTDAQDAWDHGRMSRWPMAKTERSMGHYRRRDIPFQYALADAFTVCDAYHASFQGGTNTNRLFLWTGTNDPRGLGGGPSISNSHDSLVKAGGHPDGYQWTTYAERLTKAGVSWRIYQDMADNFSDNPTAGFKAYRDSLAGAPESDPRLAELALSTRALDGLREDVLSGALPKVSWIVAPEKDSEHPQPSSPAQGADYTARVLDALTADPKVWARTVLFLMYDENDGFFDHVPPPAPPSIEDGLPAGGSTIDTAGEYHLVQARSERSAERPDLVGRPYGLGPRVPMLVISPWSRGGWVDSEVFDHTSVIRFLEARFGVVEPNISPWRRAVCGDLTSAFDFRQPNRGASATLPETKTPAARAAALSARVKPVPPTPSAPFQESGVRSSRALPYDLVVDETSTPDGIGLRFANAGKSAAVVHVYDRRRLDRAPRRYTVGARGGTIDGVWQGDTYDLWLIGPGGFHRRLVGSHRSVTARSVITTNGARRGLRLSVENRGGRDLAVSAAPNAYGEHLGARAWSVAPGRTGSLEWPLVRTGGWYDLTLRIAGEDNFLRRFAGRVESGRPSISDPAMGGLAYMTLHSV